TPLPRPRSVDVLGRPPAPIRGAVPTRRALWRPPAPARSTARSGPPAPAPPPAPARTWPTGRRQSPATRPTPPAPGTDRPPGTTHAPPRTGKTALPGPARAGQLGVLPPPAMHGDRQRASRGCPPAPAGVGR